MIYLHSALIGFCVGSIVAIFWPSVRYYINYLKAIRTAGKEHSTVDEPKPIQEEKKPDPEPNTIDMYFNDCPNSFGPHVTVYKDAMKFNTQYSETTDWYIRHMVKIFNHYWNQFSRTGYFEPDKSISFQCDGEKVIECFYDTIKLKPNLMFNVQDDNLLDLLSMEYAATKQERVFQKQSEIVWN